MTRYAMVIDLDRCYGCRACMVACKVENNTPEGHFWMTVFRLESGTYPNAEGSFLPRPCQHCEEAPCVKVCPVEARYHESTGLVQTDWDRCIGCRYCAIACPYGVNFFNWEDPKKTQYLDWDDADLLPVTAAASPAYANPDLEGRYGDDGRHVAGGNHRKSAMGKCSGCIHRVEQNLDPACVANCPADALHFGDLDDPNSSVSRVLAERKSWRLKDELHTHPRVHYVGGREPDETVRELDRIERRA